MSEFSIDSCPEVFVSDEQISRAVSRAVSQGRLRKLASRLYTRNFIDAPEILVRRHLWPIVAAYFPRALIADRTALENKPAPDGSIFIIASGTHDKILPGLIIRPRLGSEPQEDDKPFIDGLYLSSIARALLENMRPSRARTGLIARTIGRQGVEERIENLISRSGESDINRLRDSVKKLAPLLKLEKEASELDNMIGALLGTRETLLLSPTGKARYGGLPYDPIRMAIFQRLHATLRDWAPSTRLSLLTSSAQRASFAFYESYFSNFIEGTEFEVSEAIEIIFEGRTPESRPADAHDILGTYRYAVDPIQSAKRATSGAEFIQNLKSCHSLIMGGRPDVSPGLFKSRANRAGNTVFVVPELVEGTLHQGYLLLNGLETPFQRAVFSMFLVAEVHPFVDGNGRTARLMMNAELTAAGEQRIIIPTVYRNNYLSALKALSHNNAPEALIRVLDYAWRWTTAIDWNTLDTARRELEHCNAFLKPDIADEQGIRLLMPN